MRNASTADCSPPHAVAEDAAITWGGAAFAAGASRFAGATRAADAAAALTAGAVAVTRVAGGALTPAGAAAAGTIAVLVSAVVGDNANRDSDAPTPASVATVARPRRRSFA